jgi:hypothetical protein
VLLGRADAPPPRVRHHRASRPITKQGSRLVRWAAVEAVPRLPGTTKQAADFHRIADRRGTGIGRVAVAGRLLRLVYYGLGDGQVRCLGPAPAAAM